MTDEDMTKRPLPSRVLALSPSQNRGGGIEAYTASVISAIRSFDVDVVELSLASGSSPPSLRRKITYFIRVAWVSAKLRRTDTHVICFHSGLLSTSLLARTFLDCERPVTCFFYGIEIWTASTFARALRRSRSVRSVTISSFSAGAMVAYHTPQILAPTVPCELYRSLLEIDRSVSTKCKMHILSVFRLEDYAGKGGPELVEAVHRLRMEGRDITLTIAGRDTPTDLPGVETPLAPWLKIVRSPSASDLVSQYGEADLFVLATRQHRKPYPSGEGFGIVLAEAALAGLPVVAPANGGGRDAFIEGVTGVAPRDETVESLTDTIRWLDLNPIERIVMRDNARQWARRAFDPSLHRNRVAHILWDREAYGGWLGLSLRGVNHSRR